MGKSNDYSIVASNLVMQDLYSDHVSWLRCWLLKRLGCPEHAADFAQDTYIRILQSEKKAESLSDIREPRAYLSTVAGRLVFDFFRRQALEKSYLEAISQLSPETMPSEEEEHMVREVLHELDRVLDSLKPEVRSVFLLSQLQGLTYSQIAVKLGISDRTVKRYMATAFEECIMVMAI